MRRKTKIKKGNKEKDENKGEENKEEKEGKKTEQKEEEKGLSTFPPRVSQVPVGCPMLLIRSVLSGSRWVTDDSAVCFTFYSKMRRESSS